MPLKIKISLLTRFGRRLVGVRLPLRTTEPKTTTEIDITRQEYYYEDAFKIQCFFLSTGQVLTVVSTAAHYQVIEYEGKGVGLNSNVFIKVLPNHAYVESIPKTVLTVNRNQINYFIGVFTGAYEI